MAICTLKGYEFLGGKLSTKGIVASIVLMLVMTYVGNQLEWAIVVTRELGYDFLYSFQLVPSCFTPGGYCVVLLLGRIGSRLYLCGPLALFLRFSMS